MGRWTNVKQHLVLNLILCVVASVSPVMTVLAQEPDTASMSTERPTVGPCPDVIPGGSLEVEVGAGLSMQPKQDIADLPESFLRVGLTDRLELRYLTSNVVYQHSTTPLFDPMQTADSALSMKILLARTNRPGPRSAALSLNLPTGGTGLTSGSYNPTLATI
jgi:hypothetical protein